MSAYAKGKGKGKGKSSEGGKGHLLPRTRLSAEKFTGTVKAWQGKFGWIQPAEAIEHEKAGLRGGSLFCGMDDISPAEGLEVGATVEFHVWEDETGLGADEVVQTTAGEAQPKGKGKASSKGGAKGPWGGGWGGGQADAGWGAAKGAAGKGAKGGSKGWVLTEATPVQSGFGKADAKGWGKGKGKGDGKGKDGKGKDGNGKGGKGHLLPRTRITAEKFTGTVSAWKGKYGWLTPAEDVGHEKSAAHNGSLFVSKDDIQGAEELTVGSTVEFHIWEDSSGLGADEVVIQS